MALIVGAGSVYGIVYMGVCPSFKYLLEFMIMPLGLEE